MKRKCVALALLLALPLPAQEVRVNVNNEFDEVPQAVVGLDAGVMYVYAGDLGLCPGTTTARYRLADLRGSFQTGDMLVPATCKHTGAWAAAVLPSGVILVVLGTVDSYFDGIGGRLFDSSGNPLGPDFLINQVTAGIQAYGSVAALKSGRFAVAWADEQRKSVYGRIVMPDGSMPAPEVELPLDPKGFSTSPALAATASGGALLVWPRFEKAPPYRSEIVALGFDPDLSPVTAERLVNVPLAGFDDDGSVIGGNPDGTSFLVAWEHILNGTAEIDTMARWVDDSGAPLSAQFMVNTYTDSIQAPTSCAADGNGRGVVTYGSTRPGANLENYAQRVDITGAKIGPEFATNGTTPDDQGLGFIGIWANGDFVVTWGSYQEKNGTGGVFARRYFFPVSLLAAPGPSAANPPTVRALQPDGLDGYAAFTPYGAPGYGANVAAGDIDGDRVAEALTGPGPGPVLGPQLRGFEASGPPLAKVTFYAYGTLRYGVRPGAGEIDGDGFGEILTGAGAGAVFGPHIRAFDYDGTKVKAIPGISFFAYQTPKWGARAAAGDIDGDGFQELLTAPGPGVIFGPHIRAFDADGGRAKAKGKVTFFACGGGKYGAAVAASDVESDGIGGYGDGFSEILTGVGPDPSPAITGKACLYDFDNQAVQFKYEIQPFTSLYGVNVAGGDIDKGDSQEVVTAPGPDPTAPARIIAWEWDPVNDRNPLGPGLHPLGPDDFITLAPLTYGANLAVGTFE